MSDAGALEKRPAELSDETLESLPVAAANFDASFRLLAANAAFLALCEAPAPGAPLAAMLPAAATLPQAPGNGDQAEYLGRAVDGGPVSVTLRRAGNRFGAVARRVVGAADAPLAAARDALAEQDRVQRSLLALSREVALASSEDELVAAIGRAIRGLFPGRFFCVRIVEPRRHALTSLYAEGRLLEASRELFALRRHAAEKAHLDADLLPRDRVRLTDEPPLLFAGATSGLAAPLAASGQFFGMLNLEYPQGTAVDLERDERLLIQLANQAAVGVRNAKLIDELTFVKRHLEDLIEHANALILAVDVQGNVVIYNRVMSQLSGYAPDELIGKDLLTCVPEKEHERLRRVFQRSIRGERMAGIETRLLRREGGEVRVSFSTAPIATASGEVEGVIAIGQDLTKQKELEHRIIQAEKLASLGQLAAGVVHEINNPLTTITVFAESLIQKHQVRPGHDAADLDKLKRINESAGRIIKFARELTSYARPAQENPEPVDIHRMLDQAVGYCEHALRHAEATFTRSYGENLPAVKGVRQNLVQVFVNLVTNACHALPETGGAIAVVTRTVGEGVEIEVSDNGAGIEEKHLAKIFEPFFTTKPEGKGTGLGLSIVQGIVEKHGGTISVRSARGEGTTFTVFLPQTGRRED